MASAHTLKQHEICAVVVGTALLSSVVTGLVIGALSTANGSTDESARSNGVLSAAEARMLIESGLKDGDAMGARRVDEKMEVDDLEMGLADENRGIANNPAASGDEVPRAAANSTPERPPCRCFESESRILTALQTHLNSEYPAYRLEEIYGTESNASRECLYTCDFLNRAVLRLAAMRGHRDIVEWHIEKVPGNVEWEAMKIAVIYNRREIVEQLVSSEKTKGNCKAKGFELASYHGRLEIMDILLNDEEVGIDGAYKYHGYDFLSEYAGSPITAAAAAGQLAAVNWLIEKGADVNYEPSRSMIGERCQTPLIAAAARNHMDVVDSLLRAGARIEGGKYSAIARRTLQAKLSEGAEHDGVARILREHAAKMKSRPNMGRPMQSSLATSRFKIVPENELMEGGQDGCEDEVPNEWKNRRSEMLTRRMTLT